MIGIGLAALAAAASSAPSEVVEFPEKVPMLIQACLEEAVAEKQASEAEADYKYICSGVAADQLWQFLEQANIHSYQQSADGGVWLSREFPLGGCFKLVRNNDGSPTLGGLSCTIWIPRIKM
jgi:hypothetical protein